VFIKAYTKYLSTRLLNKSSQSTEGEELMLQKLKVECGHNTVNKLASMFNDIALSKDLMTEFKQSPLSTFIRDELKIEFTAEVLTNGHWPEQGNPACSLPQEMKVITTKFEQFYKNKYQNRNISWLYNNGSLELRPVYITSKPYQFVVSCYQAVVLLQYNRGKAEYTFQELRDAT